MWLLWVLPKSRPQPGSMFVSRENQIWPHFPGNHLQPPSPHTASDFFFPHPPKLFFLIYFFSFTRGFAWLMQIISLHFPFFRAPLISDLEITSKGREGSSVMSCQINAKMKLSRRKKHPYARTRSFIFFSVFLSTRTLSSCTEIYGMFSLFALLILWVS